MVNKCSVTGCKSLYIKDKTNIKLHRFPLTNPQTLPIWIAATGREKDWKPCKSSRLCGNHFRESEYIIGHGKGVLKSTAIPTIEFHIDIPKYNKRRHPYLRGNIKQMNKQDQVESMVQDNLTNFEIVQLDYNDVYISKYEHLNEDKTDNPEKFYIKNESEVQNKPEVKIEHEFENKPEVKIKYKVENELEVENDENNENTISKNVEDDCDIIFDKTLKDEWDIQRHEDEDESASNRSNQCYVLTSSANKSKQSFTSLEAENSCEESSNMVTQTTHSERDLETIMNLKDERHSKDMYSLYLRSEKCTGNYDTFSFGAFIENQMRELYPHKKLYMDTKHKIQKVLMKAQRAMNNLNNLS